MTKLILIGGVVILLGAGAFLVFQPGAEPSIEGEPAQSPPDSESVGEEETAQEPSGATHAVTYADSGYSPEELTIQQGDTVVFRNESSRATWPATAIHPSHTVYPGSGIGKCGTAEEEQIFDACGDVEPGQEWSFTFEELGTWRYHDHRRAPMTGTIIVEE